MEHKASFYATGYFGHFLTIAFILFVLCLLYMGGISSVVILVIVAFLVVTRLRHRKMSFDDDVFRYDGWIRTVRIPYSEILKVESSDKLGYPHNKTHGPLEFRITTEKRKVWVSLLFFEAAASREFRDRLIKRRKKSRVPIREKSNCTKPDILKMMIRSPVGFLGAFGPGGTRLTGICGPPKLC